MGIEDATTPMGDDAVLAALEDRFGGEPEQAVEKTEVVEAETEDTEAVVEDSDDTPDSDASESDSQADDEGLTIASFLGVPDERIIEGENGEVYIEVKVDGRTERVSPTTLVENYQREQHANAKSMEAAEQLKAITAKEEQLQAQFDEKLTQAEQVVSLASQQLLGQYSDVDWSTLEATDPGQAALLRQKMQGQYQEIQAAQQKVLAERQEQQQKAQETAMKQYQSYLSEQMDKVIADNPSWADEQVRAKGFGGIKDFMVSTYGYSEDETAGVTDARQVAILRDAMAYRQGKAKAAPKLQKSVPKFQKPGAARSKSEAADKKAKAKLQRARKTGSTRDIAAILEDRF